jgi:hypothetical protein
MQSDSFQKIKRGDTLDLEVSAQIQNFLPVGSAEKLIPCFWYMASCTLPCSYS